MKNINIAVLDRMAMRLGTEDTIDLLTFSLPLIVEREQAMHNALLMGDWESAGGHAHKTLSSVRLYGSERLEQLLRSIPTLDKDDTVDIADFQQELSAELELAINAIRLWLSTRSPVSILTVDDPASSSAQDEVADRLAEEPKGYTCLE